MIDNHTDNSIVIKIKFTFFEILGMTKINDELNPTTAAATTKSSNAVIIKNEPSTAPKSSTLTNHTGYPLAISSEFLQRYSCT